MTVSKPFPSDAGSRRAILVLSEQDAERCAYEPGASQSLIDSDEAYVLQLPLTNQASLPPALQNLKDSRLLRAGVMLIQSPFDADTYEEASEAPQKFALEKHMIFSALCGKLGAKQVQVEQIEFKTRTGSKVLDVQGERAGAGGKLSVGSEELNSLRSHMHLHDQFSGGPADIAAAENLLRRTGLWGDTSMRSLIEMRSDGNNTLKTRKLVVNLSSEARGNLAVAARLRVPAFVKLSADFRKIVQEQQDFALTVRVTF